MSLFANVLAANSLAGRGLDRAMAAVLLLLAAAPAAALTQVLLSAASAAPTLASYGG